MILQNDMEEYIMKTNNQPATKVIIPCRFSYLNCFEPQSINGSDPKYSVSAIILLLYAIDNERTESNKKDCFELELHNYYEYLLKWSKIKKELELKYD